MHDQGDQLRLFANRIVCGESLQNLVPNLRALRDAGISAHEVSTMLEELRLRYRDSPIEDRILEVLDIVTGFCSGEPIWPKR